MPAPWVLVDPPKLKPVAGTEELAFMLLMLEGLPGKLTGPLPDVAILLAKGWAWGVEPCTPPLPSPAPLKTEVQQMEHHGDGAHARKSSLSNLM